MLVRHEQWQLIEGVNKQVLANSNIEAEALVVKERVLLQKSAIEEYYAPLS